MARARRRRGESPIKQQARKWFAFNAHLYSNLTEAAENCAWALGHDEWLDDPDHWVWDLAVDYLGVSFVDEMKSHWPARRNPGRQATQAQVAALCVSCGKPFGVHPRDPRPPHALTCPKCMKSIDAAADLYLKRSRRNPTEPKRPVAVDQVVMTIWTLFESRYPDDEGDNLNPIHVERTSGGRWAITFDDWVWSYGLNDTYTYSPKTGKWEVGLGMEDGSITRRGWSTAAVLHRVDRIMDPTMTRANLGADLPRVRHRTRGMGRVAGFTPSNAGDRALAYVYWDDGRPTGAWDIFSEDFVILDGVKLRKLFIPSGA